MTGSTGLPAYAPLLLSQHRAFEPEFRAIVAALPVRPGYSVLDLACGDGAYTRWFAEAGTDVLAIDLSRAFLEVAQCEIRPEFTPDRVRFVLGDFRRLPLGDDRFDLVWCAQSLYSLPDPLEGAARDAAEDKARGFRRRDRKR